MKKSVLFSAGIMFALGAFAAPISPDQALARLQSSQAKISAKHNSDLQLAYTAKTDAGFTSAYIFTPESGAGFTILSADDRAVPVLGYSDTQKIDVNNMPPALIWWLSEQAVRVEASENARPVLNVRKSAEEREAVGPLLTTKWDQDAPYNDECPVISGTNAATGCVATSMAQCMNYFKYPQRGEGSIEYLDGLLKRRMVFTDDFDWANMLDSYSKGKYNEDQAYAVAYLMKACGYSTEMMYGQYASGTQSYKIAIALTTYFNYDKGTYFTYRSQYSSDQWEQMIYDNLKNIGPVIYNGQSLTGGHSFVCDGYDGNGFYHFNWGWSGLSDGYYVLDALNPDSQGIGGSEGGYNCLQSVVLGMQPPVEGHDRLAYGNMNIYGTPNATLDGNKMNFSTISDGKYSGWSNGIYRDIIVNVGAIIENVATSERVAEVKGVMYSASYGVEQEVVKLQPTGYYPTANSNPQVELPSLPDGRYKVYPATRDTEFEDAPWQPMVHDWGYYNYVVLTVENGKRTVSVVNPAQLTFDNVVIDSPLYYGRNTRLKSTITNNSDLQLTLPFYPVLYRNGAARYASDYMLLTIDPNETVEFENYTMYTPVSNTDTDLGEYTLRLYQSETNELLGSFGTYQLQSVSSTTKIVCNEFSVDNAPRQTVTSGSETFPDAYLVKDGENLLIILKYTVQQGYFDTPLRVLGAKYDPEEDTYIPLSEDLYNYIPFVGQGSSQTLYIKADIPDAKDGEVYRFAASYLNKSNNQVLGALYVMFDSVNSIEGINSDDINSPDEYFNLQGVKILNPERGQLLIHRKGSKTTKVIY